MSIKQMKGNIRLEKEPERVSLRMLSIEQVKGSARQKDKANERQYQAKERARVSEHETVKPKQRINVQWLMLDIRFNQLLVIEEFKQK